jgi:hypothetical protein
MACRGETPDGAWFIAARLTELSPHGPGSVSSCRICGAEVWVEADDAGLAQSCAVIACSECSSTTHGILYIPPGPAGGVTNGAGHDPDEQPEPVDAATLPVCSGCGGRVGAQEPAWIEHEDGTVHPSSRRNYDAGERSRAWRVWHVGCFVAAPDQPS